MKRSTTSRGYGTAHQRLRGQWSLLVAAGSVACARCSELIRPGQPWHLDHSDDRRSYLGPSHEACNVAASKRKAADPRPTPRTRW